MDGRALSGRLVILSGVSFSVAPRCDGGRCRAIELGQVLGYWRSSLASSDRQRGSVGSKRAAGTFRRGGIVTVCRRCGSASSSGFPPRADPDGTRERFCLPRSRRHVHGRGARSHTALDEVGLAARGGQRPAALATMTSARSSTRRARAYQDDLNPAGGGGAFLEVLARELSNVLAVPVRGCPGDGRSASRAS